MKWTVADSANLDEVLTAMGAGRTVYGLEPGKDGTYRFVQSSSWDPNRHTLGAHRPTEPLKSLFFQPREFLGVWQGDTEALPLTERIVFGVKNCDLSALSIYDHVFLDGGCGDSFYQEARQKTVLVSCDCTGFLDVCFCPVVDEQPYPIKGFDINISPTAQGAVLEDGTERGAEVLASVERYLQPASAELLAARDGLRVTMHGRLVEHAQASGLKLDTDLKAAVEGAFDSGLWEDFAADCVECGACNFICCTCHCFLLADGFDDGRNPVRAKQWDSCLFPNFARTAGGGNPRHQRAKRLRNRFDKKFSFFPEVLGRYACDGCGRCTEACIGKIDIRQVLKRAVDESLHAHPGHD